MSEYQYYQFKAIDKPLTKAEREEISSWSSRTEATNRSASFTYHYGDFPKDEEKVLVQYFDAFLYIANWGDRRLMFKFPLSLVDTEALAMYDTTELGEYGEYDLTISVKSGFVIVDMYYGEDENDWLEDDVRLDGLLGLRKDILAGDYRSLFIFWVYILSLRHDSDTLDETATIPKRMIPPKLDQLTSELDNLIEFFAIDEDWIVAAATYNIQQETPEVDYAQQLQLLSTEQKEAYLLRLLDGESNLKLKLQKELTKRSKTATTIDEEEIPLTDFLEKVEDIEERNAAEALREQKQTYLNKMKEIEGNQELLWREATYHIEKGSGHAYKSAIEIIRDLHELAKFQGKESAFYERTEGIEQLCLRKPAMLRRLRENGLLG